MREIKFRAWYKKEKRMWDILMIFFGNRSLTVIDYDTEEEKHLLFENIELLQYTGLKDKNGKEIYEDDIIKDEQKTQILASVKMIEKDEYIYFPETINITYKNYPTINITRIKKPIEVIGNRFENPELL